MRIEKRLRDSFSEITPPTDNGTIVRNVIKGRKIWTGTMAARSADLTARR